MSGARPAGALRAFACVAGAILRNRLRIIPFPVYCTFVLTSRCNYSCGMCAIWKRKSLPEIDEVQIERIFSQLRGVRFLKLDGGEVFLREDLARVTALLTRLLDPLFLQITTNGSFPERTRDFLEKQAAPALYLKISIDGPKDFHDRVRGPGAYDNAVRTLAQASAIRRKKKFNLGVNLTFSPESLDLDYLNHVRSLCQRYGAQLQCVFAARGRPLGSGEVLPDYSHFFGCERRVLEVMEELERRQSSAGGAEMIRERYFLRGLKQRLLGNKGQLKPGCVALRSHARIESDGSLVVCSNISRRVADLKKESFARAWRGVEASACLKAVSACPGCWIGCETLPNALFTGDILRAVV